MRSLVRGLLLGATFCAGLALAPNAGADDFTVCPSGESGVATDDTSCAFAENVRAAWLARPGSAVTAFSPVAQQSYLMQCAPTVTDTWPVAQRCVGVNDSGVGLVVLFATALPSPGTSSTDSGQSGDYDPSTGVGVGADSPNVPDANVPNYGCTWVDGYTKSNGTHVNGYYRCG